MGLLPGESVAAMTDDKAIPIYPGLSIPLSEFTFRFSRSGGPGGQHANRSETRVELLFDVGGSSCLNEVQRERMLAGLGRVIDQNGVLHLVSSQSRSQYQNREAVVARFRALLQQALRPPKKRLLTRPSRAARERRLEHKRHQSSRKRSRRRPEQDVG
jgi:ribosome-associated protein